MIRMFRPSAPVGSPDCSDDDCQPNEYEDQHLDQRIAFEEAQAELREERRE
jgi:hypothetical protein